jgi:hypothetical protein
VAWTTAAQLDGFEHPALYPLHTGELAVLLDVGYSRANLGVRTTFIETLFVGRAKGSPRCPEPACPAEETADPVSPPSPRS